MKSNPILICFGTRPEWIKVKPILDVLKRSEYKLLFTGQHNDLLKDIEVDYRVNITPVLSNRLDAVINDCLHQFPTGTFGGIMVQGDTASALACALAAFHRQIPIYYLEAGLRSYDLKHPYPEEGYRQIISRLSSVNFAPTKLSAKNLLDEKVSGTVHIVGNTVLDNLVSWPKGEYANTILVTLHRRENHELMAEWFSAVESLAEQYNTYDFILPIHPNPDVTKHRDILKKVNVVNPMTHDEVIDIVRNCRFIISDSGGLQEEGTFFNKKVIVCRKTTERPEGIETGHLHLCPTPNELPEVFKKIEANPYIDTLCPYGDGYSANRIKDILYDEKL